MQPLKRLGLVGYGYIGRFVREEILRHPEYGLDVDFVFNRSQTALEALPRAQVLDDLAKAASRQVDLIIEMAHPDVSRSHGEAFLRHADYMMLSTTALADAALERRLIETARQSGTRLFLPHGALVGVDNLVDQRSDWVDVSITFRKNPRNIDFSESGREPPADAGAVTVYDGPVRGIARLYPRNVNTMVTCALATVGLDRCRAVLVSDPALDVAIAEVVAVDRHGARLESRKVQPVVGVSGTEMLRSQLGSILRVAGRQEPGLQLV
jgi:predicted dinucleotide-utilizing enzyme